MYIIRDMRRTRQDIRLGDTPIESGDVLMSDDLAIDATDGVAPRLDLNTKDFAEVWSDLVAKKPELRRLAELTAERRWFLRALGKVRRVLRGHVLQGGVVGDRRFTQRWVGDRMQTAQPNVRRLETGNSDPRISTIERYVAALGMRLELRLLDDHRAVVVSSSTDAHVVPSAIALPGDAQSPPIAAMTTVAAGEVVPGVTHPDLQTTHEETPLAAAGEVFSGGLMLTPASRLDRGNARTVRAGVFENVFHRQLMRRSVGASEAEDARWLVLHTIPNHRSASVQGAPQQRSTPTLRVKAASCLLTPDSIMAHELAALLAEVARSAPRSELVAF
jgi:hypothetical protein